MSPDANQITGQQDGLSRRHFLLGVGVVAVGTAAGVSWMPQILAGTDRATSEFQPHAFLRIGSDGTITVIIGKSEMGQGVYTGLPMVLVWNLFGNSNFLFCWCPIPTLIVTSRRYVG